MRDPESLLSLAARQHGIVSRADALAHGVRPAAISRRVCAGQWAAVDRGVYRLAGAPSTWHGRLLAAVLASGGVVSDRAALALWGFDGARPGLVEITVPRGRHFRRQGVVVHERQDYDLRDETRRAAIPVTAPGRVLVDIGTRVGPVRLGDAIDEAIRRSLITWEGMYAVLVRHSCRGRDGVGVLRAVLDDRYGSEVPDSSWSRRVEELLVDAGLPRPRLEVSVHEDDGTFVARVDLAYPEFRVAIELQSWRFHGADRSGFERDPRRRNRLQLLGWEVFEYTWRFYVEHPELIVVEIRDALLAAGWRP